VGSFASKHCILELRGATAVQCEGAVPHRRVSKAAAATSAVIANAVSINALTRWRFSAVGAEAPF